MLLEMLEKYKREVNSFPDADFLKISVNLAQAKLDQYYQKFNKTFIYYIALALYLAYRQDQFEHKQEDRLRQIAAAKDLVFDLWLTDYANLDITDP